MILPTKFRVSLPFGSGDEGQNRFNPIFPIKFRVDWPFGSKDKRQIDFKNGRRGGQLGFPIGMILPIFYLIDLVAKLRVN